nr:sulfite exporter TauE/SafE family protein [Geobacter sp. OR-1]
MFAYWIEYAALGVTAGFLAGLLGVGGGLIIVPVLTFMFSSQFVSSPHIAHLAIGTSLATIVFTSISSIRSHNSHAAIDWPTVVRISPGIVLGTFTGSWVAAGLSTCFLKAFFVAFLFVVSVQLLLDIRPKSHRTLPGSFGLISAGGIIGWLSSLVGIGGGSMSVPLLIWCNMPAHRAVGTSAAIGLPIALAGSLGYIITGMHFSDLPALTLGFVYIPAVSCVAVASFASAPFGARLAHRLPVPRLKRIFAGFLLIIALKMLWGII